MYDPLSIRVETLHVKRIILYMILLCVSPAVSR